jgi:Na+-translocating ferredoxin:NAD+ oxidoreductase subunit E
MTNKDNFSKGFFRDNPVFVQLLGMCPALGVTTSAINGLGMGLATTFVLVMSSIMVALIRDFIPDKVRIPAYIVVIATFVTLVDLIMAAYSPTLHEQLGIFIPLIVVNCIVLGRAEAFASKNNLLPAVIDGLGMGLGFAMALTMLGAIREILGSMSIFGFQFAQVDGIILFVVPPGAFISLGILIAAINALRRGREPKAA